MNAHVSIKDAARGRWRAILVEIGFDPKFLGARNGPCPFCGGKDRFRFIDTNGDGTWVCNKCCEGGSGIELVKRFLGVEFGEAIRRVLPLIGKTSIQKPNANYSPEKIREGLAKLWKNSSPVKDGDLASVYLASRKCWPLPFETTALRFAPRLKYSDPDNPSFWPALLAVVSDQDGKPVTIHRTYLANDGAGKARVESPRRIMPGHRPAGCAIRLGPVGEALGVAEGVETALSAAILSGEPVWSLIDAHGLESWAPPAGVKRVTVWADADRNYTGQAAAYRLAHRVSGADLDVSVRVPERLRADWNDVLVEARE